MPRTSLTQLQQLHELSAKVRKHIDGQLMAFLEAKHTIELGKDWSPKFAETLLPVETFELEIKHKMSNAAHEMLQAIMRVEDSNQQNTELDVADYLRYARTNLEESEKDLEAANTAFKAMETYNSRIEKQYSQLSASVAKMNGELAIMLDKTKNYKKELYEKILLALNEIVAG